MTITHIEIGSKPWHSLKEEIISTFAPGDLIPHEWLKSKFGLPDFEELHFEDFENMKEVTDAITKSDFAYMFLIDALRMQLLNEQIGYLKNICKEGHTILPAHEQVTYGYDSFVKSIKKSIKKTDPIIDNVPPVSAEQQALDYDTKAKYSKLKDMLRSGIRK